jgi:hypothetical protein
VNTPAYVPAWTGSGYCVARVRPDGSMVAELDTPDAATAEREAARMSWAHQAEQQHQAARAACRVTRNRRRVRFFPDEDYP